MATARTIAVKTEPVELWFVDLEACADALDEVERRTTRLSAQDLKKITGSPSQKTTAQRRASYIALRVLIERYWGAGLRTVPYALTGSGKPVLTGLPGSFSLAHVDRYALIGLACAGAIGVDLEPDREPIVSSERRLRIESAAVALAEGTPLPTPRQQRFLQAWVRLEAVAKADGRGIGRLLTGLGIIGAEAAREPGFSIDYANTIKARFRVRDVSAGGGCVAAVAIDDVNLRQWPASDVDGGLQPAALFPSVASEIDLLIQPLRGCGPAP